MTWWSLASFLRMYSTQTFYQHIWGTSREIQYCVLKVDFQKCERFTWQFDLISFKYTCVSKSQFMENPRYLILYYTDNLQYHFVNYVKITITQGSVTWKWYLETAVISLWNSFWVRKNRNLFEKLSFLTFRNHTMNQYVFLSHAFIIERF